MYINPFYLYSLAFGSVLLLYNLRWASIYPDLSAEVVLFLLITGLIAGLIGFLFSSNRTLKYQSVPEDRKLPWIVGLIFVVLVLDIAYARTLPPLFQSIFQEAEDSKRFVENYGIPLVHAVLLCVDSLYCIYAYHLYLSSGKKRYLFWCAVLYIPLIIMFSRGTISVVFISSLFTYLWSLKKLSVPRLGFLVGVVLAVGFIFGWAGNLRTGNEDFLTYVAGATDEFKSSLVPKEYFGVFIYVTSPLANFQLNTDLNNVINTRDYGGSIALQTIVPSFLGKYLLRFADSRVPEPVLITSSLTTGTTFVIPYIFLGWLGPYLMFTYLMLFVAFFLRFLQPDNIFYVAGLGLVNSVVLLSIFDNMVAFTGTILPLLLTLVLGGLYNNFRLRW